MCPLLEIGLTDLSKSGGHVPPHGPLACDGPAYGLLFPRTAICTRKLFSVVCKGPRQKDQGKKLSYEIRLLIYFKQNQTYTKRVFISAGYEVSHLHSINSSEFHCAVYLELKCILKENWALV